MPKLRVLLTDDHPVVRAGLKALLAAQPELEVVGEADSAAAALDLAERLRPDIVVMDMSMPGLNGVRATEQLKAALPDVKVLALSVHEDKSYLQQFMEAGASGYVLKRAAPEELVNALRTVAAGGVFLDPRVARHLVPDRTRNATRKPGGEAALSEREEEVLRLLAEGHSYKEMARKLGLSVKTLETHKQRGMEKLGLESRADLVRYAVQQGWLQGNP